MAQTFEFGSSFEIKSNTVIVPLVVGLNLPDPKHEPISCAQRSITIVAGKPDRELVAIVANFVNVCGGEGVELFGCIF